MTTDPKILSRIYSTILARKDADPEVSYTASLFAAGLPSIVRKVDEEAAEAVVSGMGDDVTSLKLESADLIFHLMVLWAAKGITPEDVLDELAAREGISGHVEKTSRKES